MNVDVVRSPAHDQPIFLPANLPGQMPAYLPAQMPPSVACPPHYRRILVGYDGSGPARRALAVAATLTKVFGASLAVISLAPPRPRALVGERSPLAISLDGTFRRADQLHDAEATLAGCGVSAELLEPEGDPAEAVERLARDGGVDMIVLGGGRLGRLGRLLPDGTSGHVATPAGATVVITP